MTRSYRPKAKQVFSNQDISANVNSLHTDVEHRERALYVIDWNTGAGPLDGSIVIEYTNDDPEKAATVWTPLDFGSPILVAGVSGGHQLLIKEITWKYMRIGFTNTAGTGVMNASIKSAANGV